MNVYEPFHQINSWIDCYKEDDTCPNISASSLLEVEDKFENQSHSGEFLHGLSTPLKNQETPRSSEKMQRRLAQNREAARKCRLRKKVYIQQLESSRLKLVQLEQELQRARQQVLVPLLDPITGKQEIEVENLRQSCQQAEDALTQGMERLQQLQLQRYQ